jgi:hypothetical protein
VSEECDLDHKPKENGRSVCTNIGAPVLMAPCRLLGSRSEGRCGTNPPDQGPVIQAVILVNRSYKVESSTNLPRS